MEEEKSNKLPFLDVLVERCEFSFHISVYRKPTFTGLYLSWDSFTPRSRKLNLIKCLSFRALNICCDSKIEEELKVIKEIFINNGYPEKVIDDNINLTGTRFKNNNKIFGPLKCPVHFRLPWIGPASQSLAEKVASSVYRCYHAVKVRSIFTTKTAFNSIHKDVLPILKQSLLIYKDSHAGILSPTDSKWLTSAVLPLIYTGASLDWRLGSIYNNHPILIFQNSTRGIFLHVRLHPSHTHILQIMLKDNNSKNRKRNYLNHSKIQKILIRMRPSHYETLAQANYWLQLTRTAPGTWLYYCLTFICFRCTSAYWHRCISWLTARSRVNIYIYIYIYIYTM